MIRSSSTRLSLSVCLLSALLLAIGCGGAPSPQAPLTQNRDLDALRSLAAEPTSETVVVLMATQQFLAGHREWDGYAYFGKLAAEQPARRPLFVSLQGLMQARVASDVPLLQRVSWVESAIAKLDEGVAADPTLGRFARGLVFADLPPRFDKARQAVDDLEFVAQHVDAMPLPMHRGVYRGLAAAYRSTGDSAKSDAMLKRSGFASLDDGPRVLGDLSVEPADGFRFGAPRFVEEAKGVYVAEGYDFGNIAFLVGDAFVVAIDAGTTQRTARTAVDELRRRTSLPIKYLVLTHGHWDHAGGVAALREPGTTIIAQAAFPKVLARSAAERVPFRDFFGDTPPKLDVTPDRLVSTSESIHEGGLDLTLLPGPSGETEDALYVMDNAHGILFVGDAFMPYCGAPFAAEGSGEGYRDAIDFVLKLHPRKLLHGHPPLTALFTIEAMPGLRDATAALYAHTLEAASTARPLAELLHDEFLPPTLRSAPKAVAPFLILRDTFTQRVYTQHTGYWQSDGTGIEHFTRDEWARSLDLLAGGDEKAFVRSTTALVDRGDAPMAVKIADSGLRQHPGSVELQAARDRALSAMRDRTSNLAPFRFIVYSEWAGKGLAPVDVPPAAPVK